MGATVEDFDLAVRRDGDAVVVRVVASPAGSTPEQSSAIAGIDEWSARPSAAVAGSAARDIASVGELDAHRAGTALFRAVFAGEVGARLRASRELALRTGGALRIVLRLDAAADDLPWELLTDPVTTQFVALQHPIVHAVEVAMDVRPPIDGPLRVLVVVATPHDVAPVNAAEELAELRTTLERLTESGAIELAVVPDASLPALARALEHGPWHVVHYIGHGSRRDDRRGALVLHGPDGRAELVAGAELGRVLGAIGDVRMVVLNSCRSAGGDGRDPFAGTAAALVRAGIPTVVAMRRAVTGQAAVGFARAFYAALVAGASVEAAVTSARRALHAAGRTGTEWAIPAVYTRGRHAAAPLVPHTDDDVRFTIARPPVLRAARWETMLVFAHRAGPYTGARGETVDPERQVEARILAAFATEAPGTHRATVTSSGAVPRGTDLLVEADVPGIDCTVRGSPATWTGDVAEVLVQLRAPADAAGRTVDGFVRVFSGPLLLAESALHFDVVADGDATIAAGTSEPMRRYRRIFPCFAADDVALVQAVAAYAEASGDEYVRGVLQQGEDAPGEWMLAAIADADVFQLFWSTSSMRSDRCRRQWEAALDTGRPDFVRPLYWQRPMPRTSDLPPPALRALRFVAVPPPAVPAPAERPVTAPPGALLPPARIEVPVAGPPTAAAADAPSRRRGTRRVLAAASVLLGGLLGLAIGVQTSTSAGAVAPGRVDVSWVPALLVGSAAGLVVALLVLRGGRR